MTTIVETGVTTTLDETAGLQNATATPTPPEDFNDNDILVSALPSVFSAIVPVGTTPIGAALSGYTGAAGNTGSNIVTITGAPNGTNFDLGFVGADGAPLNGSDSGLQTLAGTPILLYTDTNNNNIVLGREGAANGQVVFALYLEETGGTPPTGAKMWSAQYVPLKNSDPNNPDDSLNLLNKVFVAASEDLEFSLAGAPSGQNLFLMFTTANPTTVNDGGVIRITDPAIVATGKDPANQSTGVNITTGDTINTSQAGGPTTFGTNSQMIVEGEGIRFSFVTGARQNVTIPNLDQNEADVEANIDFTSMFNARAATFDVVQLQSGKSAVIQVSAFNTAAEPGIAFIDGYASDGKVNITNVKVTTSTGGTDSGVTVVINGGIATISGVKAGYHIEYTTTGDHNRVLVENAGSGKGQASADFDIGGFKLLQVSKATAEIGSKVSFEDDGPSITVSVIAVADSLVVDETDLTTNASASFADNFSNIPVYGADGAGTVSSAYALSVSSAGVNSGLVDVATSEAVLLRVNGSGVVEGYTQATNALVFTVSVDPAGTVTLDQIRALQHPDATNPDDAVTLGSADLIALTRTDTITDKDGDTNTGSAFINIGTALSFEDDGPTAFSPVIATLINNGTAVATADLDTTSTASPWLPARVGADQPGSIAFVDNDPADDYLRSTALGTPILTSGGENIVLSGFGTSTLTAETVTSHSTVFTATLDPVAGQYTIDFDKAIDDGAGVTILGAAPVRSGNPAFNLIDNVGGTSLDILFSGTIPGTSTVNVSTQGAGVGNQTMNAGETLRLDLVTGGVLAGSPSGSDFNYTAHQTINGFSFLVSQNTPSGTTGTVYLKAYDADNDKILSGDAGDTVDPITKVMVNDQVLVDGTTLHTLTINGHTVTPMLFNGGVVITGLNEGLTGDGAGGDDPVITMYTADGYNRVEVSNFSGQTVDGHLLSGTDFDIAPAGIEQGVQGKPVDFALPVQVTDADGDQTPIELIGVHLDPLAVV